MGDATYRFELSKTNRALCQNSACKNAEVKIQKGEFRMGSLVFFNESASWRWKHWGCVTPVQIKNLQDQVGALDDLDLDDDLPRIIDGYDELDYEAQEKIKFALHNGHVPDEDWKGEPDLNRPGKKGINRRTPKKKSAEETDDAAAENAESPSKSKAKKGRGRKVKAEEEGDGDVLLSPTPKKKAASKRKVKVEDDNEEVEEAVPPKKARTRTRKAAVKVEIEEEDVPEDKPAKRSRAKKVKVEAEEEEVPEEKPARKTRAKKVKTEDEEQAIPPPAKRERARKVKAEEQEDEDMPDAPPEPVKRVRKSKNTAPKVEEDEEAVKPSTLQEDRATIDPSTQSKLKRAKQARKGRAVKKEEHAEDADGADNIPDEPEAMAESNVKAEAGTDHETQPTTAAGGMAVGRQNDVKAVRTAKRTRGKKVKPEPEPDAEENAIVKAEDEGQGADKVSSPVPDSTTAAVIKTDAEAGPDLGDAGIHPGLEASDIGVGGVEGDQAEEVTKPARAPTKRQRKAAKGRAK